MYNIKLFTVDSGCLAYALILKTVRKYALNKGLCAYNTRPHPLMYSARALALVLACAHACSANRYIVQVLSVDYGQCW